VTNALKTIYLALGSNVGDRAAHLARAIECLPEAGVRPLRQSSIYLTEPVGGIDQRPFLNCALEAETGRMPLELLRQLQQIEWALGRRRRVAMGPRPIDIDILFYGSSVIRTPELVIPHPRLADRRFVLVPLSEIAPGLRHPVLQRSVAELLASTPDRGFVRRWRDQKESSA
jgi:2-amino-4-hydroxy-6-hydroxymethyldihydropteridine diphosphokinase